MLELVLASLRESMATVTRGAEGGQVVELPGGVEALISPTQPDRSFFNSVSYLDTAGLLAGLDDVAAAYQAAGVRAWTVYVPEADREAAQALASAGHLLDAAPRAMGRSLDGELPPAPDDWSDGSVVEISELNAVGYGAPRGFGPHVARASGAVADDCFHRYVARDDAGAAVSCVLTIDCAGDDCCVIFVATDPAAQRAGHARRLMAASMHEARERGCPTTTLWATKAGAPVYARCGYEDFGALQMWERRAPKP